MKHLILLAGGSCAGKTTLAKQAKFPKIYNIEYFITGQFWKVFCSWKRNMELGLF